LKGGDFIKKVLSPVDVYVNAPIQVRLENGSYIKLNGQ